MHPALVRDYSKTVIGLIIIGLLLFPLYWMVNASFQPLGRRYMLIYFSRPSFLSSCCACLRIFSLMTRSNVKFFSTTPARISSSSMI